jgi:predicted  nucleic acid-binding Zn-ribbon protein
MKTKAETHKCSLEGVPLEVLLGEAKRRRRIHILERDIERNRERIQKAEARIEAANKEIGELKAAMVKWKAAA